MVAAQFCFNHIPTALYVPHTLHRNELLGQTNAYLEAEYICRPGFRLARTNHSTTVFCRKRRWIGHAPRCERKFPTQPPATAPTTAFDLSAQRTINKCPSDAARDGRCHRPLCRQPVGVKSNASSAGAGARARRSCRWCRTGFQLNATDNLCWGKSLSSSSRSSERVRCC